MHWDVGIWNTILATTINEETNSGSLCPVPTILAENPSLNHLHLHSTTGHCHSTTEIPRNTADQGQFALKSGAEVPANIQQRFF